MTNEKSHKSYRPLTVATFRFTYWLSGFDTKTFHLFNILLHAINRFSFIFLFGFFFFNMN